MITPRLQQSNLINEHPKDVPVLLERQQQLMAPRQPLPELSLRGLGKTGHTDPQLGRRIMFGE